MIRSHRKHAGYWAFLLHRLSGLALVLFLPLHFLTLGLALKDESALESFLRWSDQGAVKLAEFLLVVLLALHFTGGLRLLALEFLSWSDRQKTWIALGAGASLGFGLLFLFNLL